MRFAHNQNMVETFAPHTPKQSFADRVRAWRFDRCSHHLQPASHCDGIELSSVFSVVVTDQIPWRLAEGSCLPQLLSHPRIGRRAGNADVDDASGAEFGDDEGEEWLENRS